MQNRIIWIDYAKVIAIFLVVLAHTPLLYSAEVWIYVFHMPFFFFASGYLFTKEKYASVQEFIRKRFKQLIVPYLFFSVCTYLFWVFVGRKFGNDSLWNVEWYQPIIGIFYAVGRQPWLIHCIPLWFLACLFCVEMIYFTCFKTKYSQLLIASIFCLLGYVDYQYDPYWLPWSLNISLVAVFFYALGNNGKLKMILQREFKITTLVISLILAIISVTIIANMNGKIAMHQHSYGNYILFLIGGVAGIILLITLAMILSKVFSHVRWIEFVSKNTLTILALHLIVGSFIKAFVVYVLHSDLSIFNDAFWLNVLFSIISILMILPMIVLLNRYAPVLIGKRG